MYFNSDQLFAAKNEVDSLKGLSRRLFEVVNLFLCPHTGEACSVGTALRDVTSRLDSALSATDAQLEIPDKSLLVNDRLLGDENTKYVDDKCSELRESIMLVIQSLYKLRSADVESHEEDEKMNSDEGKSCSSS